MAIGYTEIDFVNSSAPALNATNLNKMDEAIKECADLLDAETAAGRALVEAADADAQRTALGLGDSATLDVGTGAGDVAAGNAPAGAVTTHESTYAHANIPTADEKTRLGDIQAATGASTALKLANLTENASTTQEGVALLGASGGAAKLTKMPDGAAAVYSNDAWTDISALTFESATQSVSDGVITVTPSTPTGRMRYGGAVSGKTVLVKVKRLTQSSNNFQIRSLMPDTSSITHYNGPLGTDYQIVTVQLAVGATALYLICDNTGASVPAAFDWLWIGDYSYSTGSLSQEAARIANLRGDMPGVGAYASQTITASTTTLPTATKGDTIGGKKYTFVASLTASPGVEGEVLIDASGGDDATKCKNTLENLNLAISEAARTNNGTLYWAAAVNPLVSSARVNEVLTLTAKTKNGPENTIGVVCESGTQHTAGGATLLGGYTDSAAKTKAENNAALGYTPAATPNKTATTAIGYFAVADCVSGAQVTLPAGGTWAWEVTTYGATYNSVKSGTAAGGAAISGTASANLCMRYERIA